MTSPTSTMLIDNSAIANKIRGQFSEVVLTFRREVQQERTAQLIRLQMYNRLWKGDPNNVPMLSNSALRYVPLYETSAAKGRSYPPQYRLNYYTGDGQKLIGALSTMPGMKIECDDNTDPELQSRKRIAEEIKTRLYRQWQLEFIAPEIVQAMYERGNVFIHTPYVVDSRRFGLYKLPNLVNGKVTIQPAHFACVNCGAQNPVEQAIQMGSCMECGNPLDQSDFRPAVEDDGQIQDPNKPFIDLPKGSVDFKLYDSSSVFTTFHLKKWDDVTWLCHEEEQYKGSLIAAYPWLNDEQAERRFQGGGSDDVDDAFAYMTRKESTSQQGIAGVGTANYSSSGLFDRNVWWKHTCWYMVPEMFHQLDDRRVREHLLSNYPSGAKLIFINNVLGAVQPAMLHKEWVGSGAYVGAGFYQKPLGEEHANAAPLINSMTGIIVSTAQKGSPLVLYDADLFDLDHLRDKAMGVQEFIKTVPANGKSLRDMLFQTAPATLSPHVAEVFERFVSGARENGNINPPMWGAGAPEQTLGATSLKRDQAMQPHVPTFGNIRKLLARAMDNGIYQQVSHANPNGEVFFSLRPGESETYSHPEMASLLRGGIYTYVDERIPMNWGQKEAKIWQLLGLPPEISMPLLGMDRPNNITTIQEAIGFKELKTNRVDAYNKVMRNIGLLSRTAPITDPMNPAIPPMPSIPVDEFEDDHLFCAEVVKEWAQTEQAHELRNDPVKGNPDGYMNVILWAQQHLMIVNMQMMQQQQQAMVGPDGQPIQGEGGGGPTGGPGGGENLPINGGPQPQPAPGAGVPHPSLNPGPQELQGIIA